MLNSLRLFCFSVILISAGCSTPEGSPKYQGINEEMFAVKKDSLVNDTIVYHRVRVDQKGNILPWYSSNPGTSYDYVLDRVWNFWKNIESVIY